MDNSRRNAKNRGKDNEYQVVEKFKKNGFSSARRVPLSGAIHDFPGDVEVPEKSLLVEAKVYATSVDVAGEEYVRMCYSWLPKIAEEAKRAGFARAVLYVRGRGKRSGFFVLSEEEFMKFLSQI